MRGGGFCAKVRIKMITCLQGQAQIMGEKMVVMTRGGVGYGVMMTNTARTRLHGEEAMIYTHQFLREDRSELYGFERMEDLVLFEILITVSGLGPKTALGMFEVGGAERIIAAVQNADLGFFSAVPRVGKKLAQKIVIELKGKLGGVKDLDLGPKSQNYQDAKDGLLSLGYGETEIDNVLAGLGERVEAEDLGSLIKVAIKQLTAG